MLTLAVPRRWRRLPRRTIRLRLTALCAVLFLASGAGLLAVTYVLVDNHTPMAETANQPMKGRPVQVQAAVIKSFGIGSQPGVCLTAVRPPTILPAGAAVLRSDHPPTPKLSTQCAQWVQGQVTAARANYLTSLLTDSGIALGLMAVAAFGLGWLVSGRVLRPLRTITLKAQQISASNLHERLAVTGPDDELKDLGDTMDGLLARLESAFAAQRQFVANASHELRTPLARQQAMVEVALADPARSVASLEAVCGRVLVAGQQQEQLIEGLLTLARSQRGLDRLEPVNLAAITRETTESRSGDAHQRAIQLTVLDGRANFAGDARLTERLVTNLLDNAIRHNHPGGRVLARTYTASGQAVLSVVNSGPVLEPAEVPALFEPFRRAGAARTATGPGGGLGLGLSIVAAIARAHGADVRANPQPDGGLDVEVRFGCAADHNKADHPDLVAVATAR